MQTLDHFEFRPGSRFQPGVKADADLVGKSLEEIKQTHGGVILPPTVVEEARGDNHPLHGYFEWNKDVAAHEHNLAQARALIKSVVAVYVTVEHPDKPETKVAAYTNIRDGNKQQYEGTLDLLGRPDTRALLLQRAWNDLQAWKRKYQELQEFAALVGIIDKMQPPVAS